MRQGGSLRRVAVIHPRESFLSQEGTGSGVAPGHLANVILTFQPYQNRWEAYSNTITQRWRSHRVPLCFTVSSYLLHCINVHSKMLLQKSKGGSISSSYYRTSRWISSFMHMSKEPRAAGAHGHIIMHEERNMLLMDGGSFTEQSIRGLDKD